MENVIHYDFGGSAHPVLPEGEPAKPTLYHEWLHNRFGETADYNPPLSVFLTCTRTTNAYISHFAQDADPVQARLDAYVRKGWHRDCETLCVANFLPAGTTLFNAQAWRGDEPGDVAEIDQIHAFIDDLERLASVFKFKRVAWENPAIPTRFLVHVLRERGYRASETVEGDFIKAL